MAIHRTIDNRLLLVGLSAEENICIFLLMGIVLGLENVLSRGGGNCRRKWASLTNSFTNSAFNSIFLLLQELDCFVRKELGYISQYLNWMRTTVRTGSPHSTQVPLGQQILMSLRVMVASGWADLVGWWWQLITHKFPCYLLGQSMYVIGHCFLLRGYWTSQCKFPSWLPASHPDTKLVWPCFG